MVAKSTDRIARSAHPDRPADGPGAASAPERPGAARERVIRLLALALLAAAVFFAFAGVLRNGWVLWDDPDYVSNQPRVTGGLRLDNALWFLSHPHAANWHPLTSWSHMLDVQLFGLEPAGHHATSLLLHVLNAVLLALVLARLTGAWWRSLAVAALFALHPLRVESVAWVSERKDVLSGLFFVLTLGAYGWWVERPGRSRYALLMLALALGLMSKPMLVTLPFVLLLLDVWPLGRLALPGRGGAGRGRARPLRALLLEKWPLFALAAASALVTFIVQRRIGAVVPVEAMLPSQRLTNALISYWRYIGRTLWPDDLAVYYQLGPAVNWAGALAGALGLVLATAACVALARRRPYLGVGWLWYLGTLVPVIGLVQVGSQSHADRYTYLPVIGLTIALVWLVGELVSRSRAGRTAAAAALALALAALLVATARQVAVWKDTRTLFTHTLAVTGPNPVAYQCLGCAFLEERKPEPAIAALNKALRLSPGYQDAHQNLGHALVMAGRHAEAVPHFRTALGVKDKAVIRHALGEALEALGRPDEAMREYEAAVALEPDRFHSLVLLAKGLASRGRLPEAEARLRRALELNPVEVEPRRMMAVILALQDRAEEAVREYREILRRSPDDLDALNNVAWIRATHAEAGRRDGPEAVRLAERAVAASPGPEAVLYSTLAAAHAEAGNFPEAVRAGERAVALARAGGAAADAGRYETQLRLYRAGRPFHFTSGR
jgi:tetratricopeptide (TPR) repeat protein